MHNKYNITELPKRLKKARFLRSLTQQDLANKTGIHHNEISFLETGRRKPNVDKIIKIASALNLSIDYLLGGH